MTSLINQAELKADKARELAGFAGFSLIKVRESVSELLRLIGQAEGIFTGYTKHDISHIDSMLKMLDWLIPTQTSKAMTQVDWLTIVLAVYFHDLGMLVSSDEFDQRHTNPVYMKWLESFNLNSDGKDFLDRTGRQGQRAL